MFAIEDLQAETIDQQAKNGIESESELRTDNSKSHRG
jgi:hypothetical protein